MASTPEEGKGPGGSGKDDSHTLQQQEEEGGSGGSGKDDSHTSVQQEENNEEGDSSSEDDYFENLRTDLSDPESEPEFKRLDSDLEYGSEWEFEDLIRGDERYPMLNALLNDDADALLSHLPRTDQGKPDCNLDQEIYETILHRACMSRKNNCAKALIRGGADILAGYGERGAGVAFHFACIGSSLNLIEYMIRDAFKKGQDTLDKMISATDFKGKTPLDYVRRPELYSAVMELVDSLSSNKAHASPSKKPRTK